LTRSKGLRRGVIEAEGQRRLPFGDVAVGEVFSGEGFGETGEVGEARDVVGVDGELGEVVGEVVDEVAVEDDALVV
jgi:hypothetical protein